MGLCGNFAELNFDPEQDFGLKSAKVSLHILVMFVLELTVSTRTMKMTEHPLREVVVMIQYCLMVIMKKVLTVMMRQNLNKFAQESFLYLMEMKQKIGCSMNHFEELLKWGRDLHKSGNINAAIHWPKKWDEVQSLLKELGISEPNHLWICFSKDLPCHH
ncbi:hypothetical protein pdam_00016876 [Pocillopora damicornis]|uniref:Uncharacterized protein n=1 Tax=Pocillopora damicornis TaxID=46731 RepID=A0A3M6UFZ5_POCDA|nr:hypothetical protein pdam_00016876 [Pocillopora damicornis]